MVKVTDGSVEFQDHTQMTSRFSELLFKSYRAE